jgi:hypothetical protein
MAIDYFRLARKIASAKAPPAWLRSGEEWQALQAIVGGWLATTSVIAVPDTASGYALVDKDTGERREHEPGVDVGRARPMLADFGVEAKTHNQRNIAKEAAEDLTPAMRVAIVRLYAREKAGDLSPFKLNPALRLALTTRGLADIADGLPLLTEFGHLVHEAMQPAADQAKGEP